MDYSKYEQYYDMEELKKAHPTTAQGDYERMPDGEYSVEVEDMELAENRKDETQLDVVIRYRIIEGDYKGRGVTRRIPVRWSDTVLRELNAFGVFEPEDIYIEDFNQLAELLGYMMDAIRQDDLKFAISLSTGKTGFQGAYMQGRL